MAPWGGFVGVVGRVTWRNRGVVLWLLGVGDMASVGGVVGGGDVASLGAGGIDELTSDWPKSGQSPGGLDSGGGGRA